MTNGKDRFAVVEVLPWYLSDGIEKNRDTRQPG